jgi:hypothetical protein
MALRKTFIEESEVVTLVAEFGQVKRAQQPIAMDCYVKVLTVNASKEKATTDVGFIFEKSQKVRTYSFVPVMNGGNFIAQAYEHLKTLPEFAGAVDC